ncbi:hypothetical protein D3C71_2009530 [compost metagenome]
MQNVSFVIAVSAFAFYLLHLNQLFVHLFGVDRCDGRDGGSLDNRGFGVFVEAFPICVHALL